MCIAITLQPGATLDVRELTWMDKDNPDGFGIAWTERGEVHYQKSISLHPKQMARMVNNRSKKPRLVHLRWATAGDITPELCHPFPLTTECPADIAGTAPEVLIHNGHWGDWDRIHDVLLRLGHLPDPDGHWSDTRLATWLTARDRSWIKDLGGKAATLDGDGNITHHGDWKELRAGVHVSNTLWKPYKRTIAPMTHLYSHNPQSKYYDERYKTGNGYAEVPIRTYKYPSTRTEDGLIPAHVTIDEYLKSIGFTDND